jgi:AAA15 family ATPase/GTPase
MRLISEISIEEFRSIRDAELKNLGNFTGLAGLNNSGKSNVLRALNAFFTGYTDGDIRLSVDADYSRRSPLKKNTKKKKKIRIAVRFSLPESFRFRKGLEPLPDYLGDNFSIAKFWDKKGLEPQYYLNDEPVKLDDRPKIDAFLNLISFRYIPNRVLPLDVIRREHQALRDVLVRRLSRRSKDDQQTFEALREKSAKLIRHLSTHMSESCPDVASVRLAMPASWSDMAFAFGYRLTSGNIEVDDSAQGSGIQSLLMLETLSLIDRDYFQQFGWKQASVWALEEPESSLHSTLEATVAKFLADISTDNSSRLQVIATTHSDLILQYADRAVFVSKKDNETILSSDEDKRAVLERAATSGISRWVHPILANPLEPIVLVEGKSDYLFLQQALRIQEPSLNAVVSYLGELERGSSTGGVEELQRYIKNNIGAIRSRLPAAPVIIVLDWDSASKKVEFDRWIGDTDRAKVVVWPESTFNPILSKAFRGLERHLTNGIIDEAGEGLVAVKPDGTRTIERDDLAVLKQRMIPILQRGITVAELQHARPFISILARTIRGLETRAISSTLTLTIPAQVSG